MTLPADAEKSLVRAQMRARQSQAHEPVPDWLEEFEGWGEVKVARLLEEGNLDAEAWQLASDWLRDKRDAAKEKAERDAAQMRGLAKGANRIALAALVVSALSLTVSILALFVR